MKVYKVALTRDYLVSIKAENEEKAKRFSEFFLGDCPDLSTEKDCSDNNFHIEEVEMVYNDAFEIVEVID